MDEATPKPASFEDSREDIEHAIRVKADALAALLRRFPTIDVLAHFAFSENYADPTTYSEETHQGQPAFVEYLTLIALRQPCSPGEPPFAKLDMSDVHAAVSEVFRLAYQLAPPRLTLNDPNRQRLGWLGYLVHQRGVMFRNPGFPRHRDEVLDGTCGTPEVDSWLRRTFGFGYEDARLLNRGAESLLNKRLTARRDEARGMTESYRRGVKAYQKKRPVDTELDLATVKRLARLKQGQLKNQLLKLGVAAVFGDYRDLVQFTAAELAQHAGVSLQASEAYLTARASQFGSIPADFFRPDVRDELLLRPLVEHKGRYMVPAYGLLDWGLRPFVEYHLNPESKAARGADASQWQSYKDTRAAYLESAAVQAFASAMPGARAETNLKYRLRVDGEVVEGEVDGLVAWGPAAILIEAKSGVFSLKARGGSLPQLEDALSTTLAKAQQQLATLNSLIKRGLRIPFRRNGELVWELDSSTITRTASVAVTLEDMSMYTTWLRQLIDTGVMVATDVPWAVLIYDLRVITELCETPSQLLCFMERRAALTRDGRFSTSTELDYWGWFLDGGLRFGLQLPDNVDGVQLASGTREIEQYYDHLEGWRTVPTPRPRWSVPETFKLVVRALDASADVMRLEASLDLLEFASDEQVRWAAEIDRYLRLTRADGKVRGLSVVLRERPRILWVFVMGPAPSSDDINAWLARQPRDSMNEFDRYVCFAIGPGPQVMDVVIRTIPPS